ncbi:MAG: FHA domain-containing protein [Myxococcota bacterium]|nr:FHA domain-containing protein [Myxococcota bacterium]
MLHLSVEQKNGPTEKRSFVKGEISIGRSTQNDIVLPKHNISKRHAIIDYKKTTEISIVDRRSTNGTFVNGHRIDNERSLSPGDKIFLGDYTIEISEVEQDSPDAQISRQETRGSIRPETLKSKFGDDWELSGVNPTGSGPDFERNVFAAMEDIEKEEQVADKQDDPEDGLRAQSSLSPKAKLGNHHLTEEIVLKYSDQEVQRASPLPGPAPATCKSTNFDTYIQQIEKIVLAEELPVAETELSRLIDSLDNAMRETELDQIILSSSGEGTLMGTSQQSANPELRELVEIHAALRTLVNSVTASNPSAVNLGYHKMTQGNLDIELTFPPITHKQIQALISRSPLQNTSPQILANAAMFDSTLQALTRQGNVLILGSDNRALEQLLHSASQNFGKTERVISITPASLNLDNLENKLQLSAKSLEHPDTICAIINGWRPERFLCQVGNKREELKLIPKLFTQSLGMVIGVSGITLEELAYTLISIAPWLQFQSEKLPWASLANQFDTIVEVARVHPGKIFIRRTIDWSENKTNIQINEFIPDAKANTQEFNGKILSDFFRVKSR